MRKAALVCLLGGYALAYAVSTWQVWLGAPIHYLGAVAAALLLARDDDGEDSVDGVRWWR